MNNITFSHFKLFIAFISMLSFMWIVILLILPHPGGQHCLRTYCAFQKLEWASRTSNFENEIVLALKKTSIPCMLWRNWLMWLDSFDWKWNSQQKKSGRPVQKNRSSERVPRVLSRYDLQYFFDWCNCCFHCWELYFPIWHAFFSVSGYRLLHEVVIVEWSGGVAETCWKPQEAVFGS